MKIEFLHQVPGLYMPAQMTVRLPVRVDGQPAQIDVSIEALQDKFGLQTNDAQDAVATFQANRAAIEAVASRALQATNGGPALLKSEHF